MSEQSYLVSARKYRPLLFKDVVAQEHVTETLKNAIRLDRLAHAYMFTGPRGVGKTTIARILAKAINCTTPPEDREDRSEPCRACVSCESFEEGRNLNIFEIDAASNNKVDDVRDLRETVRIPPQGARMKVYIIDEVHMLSTAAFNALLKTLEEPPPHILFIFATTEPHKVLPTIQSRCQRFDFRRIAIPETISRLNKVCAEEHITADEASLMLIARKGDGALRDALSVFDQAVSLCGTNLVYEELIQALGVVDTDVYFHVTDAAADGNVGEMIRIVDRIVRSGYDLQEFLDGLAEHLRNLLVVKTVGDQALIEATAQVQDRYASESGRFSESVLLRYVHIVGETSDSLRLTRQPRLRLEMALLKIASLPSALDIRTALDKLDRIEAIARDANLKDLSAEPARRAAPAATEPTAKEPAVPDRAAKEPAVPDLAATEPAVPDPAATDPAVPDPAATEPAVSDPAATEPAVSDLAATEPAVPDPAATEPAVSDRAAKEPAVPDPAAKEPAVPDPAATEPASEPSLVPGTLSLGFDEPALKRPSPGADDAAAGDLQTGGSGVVLVSAMEATETAVLTSPDTLVDAWSRVVSEIMETQIRLGSVLRQTKVLSVSDGKVLIGVPDDFHERMLRNERKDLASRLSDLAGIPVSDLRVSVDKSLIPPADGTDEDSFDAREFLKQKCEENPAVQLLMERFGGEIVW